MFETTPRIISQDEDQVAIEPFLEPQNFSWIANHPRLGATISALGLTAALAACGPADHIKSTDPMPISQSLEPTASPNVKNHHTSEVRDLHDPDMQARAARIISTFENSTTNVQYDYAQVLADGRGITAGRAGFCTGSDCGGDLLQVVRLYSEKVPGNPLAKYIPALERANQDDTIDNLSGLAETWRSLGDDQAFKTSQDVVFNQLYLEPALRYAQKVGITTTAGELALLDTTIQHGDGNDPDSVSAIVDKTLAQQGPVNGDETAWLRAFLENRKAVLENPANKDTAAEWRQSVSRVSALGQIIAEDPTLKGALHWTVYGDSFGLRAEG